MNLQEYQAKHLLAQYGVPLIPGFLAYTPREAQKAAVNLGSGLVVVKAQVHAGGRGKAGGVKLAKTPEEALQIAEKMLGMKLVTPQTGEQGCIVKKVFVTAGVDIKKEFYLSLVVDRENCCISFIVSADGGVEIEEVAAKHPEKILKVPVKPESGLQDFHARKIAAFLKVEKEKFGKFSKLIKNLYAAFIGIDCSMLEINPLIEDTAGEFICLDAKISIDENALFRQKAAFNFMDYDEIDEKEILAAEIGISYVALDGNIGCMVNGAGLAMATMDMIKSSGGEPANFLDVGGGANQQMVTDAFKLILKDPAVKGILVNIFGGIMRCDVIATGVVEAAKALQLKVPLVVRLEGTNVELGKEILNKSGLKITAAEDMADAARKIVEAVR